jgi:hypothetical protein
LSFRRVLGEGFSIFIITRRTKECPRIIQKRLRSAIEAWALMKPENNLLSFFSLRMTRIIRKKLYLLSPEEQFSEPDSHAFYKFPCLLKVGNDLFELHLTAGAINISIPRDQEKKLLRDLKSSIRSSLSKRNNDSSDFLNNIKKNC